MQNDSFKSPGHGHTPCPLDYDVHMEQIGDRCEQAERAAQSTG